MKILAIAADINPEKLGGAEKHFVEVSRRMISKGAKIEILKVNYPHIKNISGLLYILFATLKACFLAKQKKVDLIWATLDYPQAQVGAMVKLFTGKPLYITSQNPMLGEEELVGIGGKLVKFLVSFAFQHADTVAAVSNYSANLAKNMGAKNIIIIPNGI